MSSPMAETKAFKEYFDRSAAKALAQQVSAACPSFDEKGFVGLAVKDLKKMEMMDRVKSFSSALREYLPNSMPKALSVLTKSLPPELPDCEQVTDGYLQWPVGQFIADYGVDHFDASMKCMIALTKRFSSEFAVRPFVERYPEKTFARLLALTEDPNPHVRRWCSEGIRPRLPWGKRLDFLVADPSPIFPILEKLKDDPEEYVRRSVANNLNDIAKDHPGKVLKLCSSWSRGKPPNKDKRSRLVRHALRTLIKKGEPEALKIIGFGDVKQIEAGLKLSAKRVEIGDSAQLNLVLKNKSTSTQNLLVDYCVHYVKSNGKQSPKVFKWKSLTLAKGEEAKLAKKHSFKVTTIRPLYPGVHRIEVQINGKRSVHADLKLVS